MTHALFFWIAAGLLTLGTLGHTLGGMLGIAKNGPGAGPEADRVLADMKAVSFTWRGAKDCTWFAFWMGNGLGVSALLVLTVAVLVTLARAGSAQAALLRPLAWITAASLGALAALGVKYFATRVGVVFGLVAALAAIGAALMPA